MGPQSRGSPNLRDFGTHTWESRDEMTGASLEAKHKVYYKGEGGDFPQIQVVVNLVSPCLPVAYSCIKMFQLRTNQFIVWFAQVRVSD
jgi:hypothetical protein